MSSIGRLRRGGEQVGVVALAGKASGFNRPRSPFPLLGLLPKRCETSPEESGDGKAWPRACRAAPLRWCLFKGLKQRTKARDIPNRHLLQKNSMLNHLALSDLLFTAGFISPHQKMGWEGESALIDSGKLIKACTIFIRAALVSH